MGYNDKTWYVGSSRLKYYSYVLLFMMCILSISVAYLFWLANNKKCNYQEFCMGYSDETWYVSRSGLKYYQCVLLLFMRILSTSFAYLFWLANNKKLQISHISVKTRGQTTRVLLDIPPRCIFCEYSEHVIQEPLQNSTLLCIQPYDKKQWKRSVLF